VSETPPEDSADDRQPSRGSHDGAWRDSRPRGNSVGRSGGYGGRSDRSGGKSVSSDKKSGSSDGKSGSSEGKSGGSDGRTGGYRGRGGDGAGKTGGYGGRSGSQDRSAGFNKVGGRGGGSGAVAGRPRSGGRDDRGGRGGRDDRGGRGGEKLWTRGGQPARGDRDARREEIELTEEQKLARELRAVRPRHDDPEIPEGVTASELDRIARNELKTLSKENADWVAEHLVMASRLIDDDPQLAHQHALSAARRAGRIALVRETLAITAYQTGDFALALRELRTYRRISGSDSQIALMVDSERGIGRPAEALELGRSVDRGKLPADVRVSLAIAMSGARLDLGQSEAALAELQIPQLDANTAYSYSPELFRAYAEVLDELGRADEAESWWQRADVAEDALEGDGPDEHETIDVVEEVTEGDGALPIDE
jgi:hypothetical protein